MVGKKLRGEDGGQYGQTTLHVLALLNQFIIWSKFLNIAKLQSKSLNYRQDLWVVRKNAICALDCGQTYLLAGQ